MMGRGTARIATGWVFVSGRRPALIVVGGFAGSGKSTLTRRLSGDLGIPRLGSDTISRVIRESEAVEGREVNAGWIAHDVVFGLCDDFLRSGISTILDLNMGRAFQWERVDAIARAHPEAQFLPIVLRCPREVCLERIARRHAERPDRYEPPAVFTTDAWVVATWDYLERLERPDVHVVDAAPGADAVYAEVREYLAARGVSEGGQGRSSQRRSSTWWGPAR
jgi:predicted kinase